MSFFESYETIPAIQKLLPEDRYRAFRQAHSELKRASPDYRGRCRVYMAGAVLICIPLPLVFSDSTLGLFAQIWLLIGGLPLLLITWKYHAMQIDEVNIYLRNKEKGQQAAT